jgi:hypothetical protein
VSCNSTESSSHGQHSDPIRSELPDLTTAPAHLHSNQSFIHLDPQMPDLSTTTILLETKLQDRSQRLFLELLVILTPQGVHLVCSRLCIPRGPQTNIRKPNLSCILHVNHNRRLQQLDNQTCTAEEDQLPAKPQQSSLLRPSSLSHQAFRHLRNPSLLHDSPRSLQSFPHKLTMQRYKIHASPKSKHSRLH